VINHPSPIKATELLDSLECIGAAKPPRSCGPAVRSRRRPAGCSTSRDRGGREHRRTIEIHVDDLAVDLARSLAHDREPTAAQRSAVARLLRVGTGAARRRDGAGAWLTHTADPKLVFETPPDQMWDAAMRSLGVNPADLFVGRGVN